MNTVPVARLRLATDAEYAEFAALQLKEYARQLVRAGEVAAEDGAAAAAERLQDLLADRLRPIGHTFFVATPAQGSFRIGWVWLSPAPEFIGSGREPYALAVSADCRRASSGPWLGARNSHRDGTALCFRWHRVDLAEGLSIGIRLLAACTRHMATSSQINSRRTLTCARTCWAPAAQLRPEADADLAGARPAQLRPATLCVCPKAGRALEILRVAA
jgi:hypothetical protein